MATSKEELSRVISSFLRSNGLESTLKAFQEEVENVNLNADCELTRRLSKPSTNKVQECSLQREDGLSLETRLVSFNASKNDPYGAASMPIYQTATFAQPSAIEFGSYDYTRSGNPTRSSVEALLCELDEASHSFCFSTGMAAIMAVTRLVCAGQEIIVSDDSYGGTYRLLTQCSNRHGISTRFVDMSGPDGPARLRESLSDSTALVMVESPTNPLMKICSIQGLAEVAHSHGCLLSVDNTLLSPVLMTPLKLGADVVVTSCTKFASGHSDVMAGVVSVRSKELAETLAFHQNAEGTALSPFDSWLLLRGMKTLHLRVERAQQNAIAIAAFLRTHPRVTKVYFVGLEDHPDRSLHEAQANGAGSVVCFCTGSYEYSTRVASLAAASGLFKITVSFGSVNSLISLPGDMSHASIPDDVKAARAFPSDLIRLSIGIESAADLIQSLRVALEQPHE